MTEVVRSEVMLPGPAEALAALLDTDPPASEFLPAMWHGAYLLDRPRQQDLGPDGHPARGGVPSPPAPGLQRMFAGGRVVVASFLRFGVTATRRTRVSATATKEGRSGPLTFVTVTSEYSQDGKVAIVDEQDLVYRDPTPPLASKHPAADGERESTRVEGERRIGVDPSFLFRFSALTYNAHRIHYDRGYAVDAEGYPGLLVHGPLQALLMIEHAHIEGAAVDRPHQFAYRLVSPLFDQQGLVVGGTVDGETVDVYVRDDLGRRTATGRVDPGVAR